MKSFYHNNIYIWLFPVDLSLRIITLKEERIALQLDSKLALRYKQSRGYMRYALSNIFKISPLDIPLESLPSKPPILGNGYGHISLSHCNDAFLVGWSMNQIGVDIEQANRSFQAEKIAKRFFSSKEKEMIQSLDGEDLRSYVLDQWVIKESAIKWQKGFLSNNIDKWSWRENDSLAIHKNGKKVNIYKTNFMTWKISVACNTSIKDKKKSFPFICFTKQFI